MKTVFIDVDTQLDFLYPAGALYVPQAESIVPAIARLNRFAAARGIAVVSTADAHTEDDAEFAHWPPHCVAGTFGQRKAEATLLERRIVVPNRECALALDGAPQIVVEKQTVDAFQSRHFAGVVEALGAESFVVYGVVTEVCVGHAARGLLQRGKPVTVIADAIQSLSAAGGEEILGELRAAGARLAAAAEIYAA